jgi:hypothetical protein
VKKVGTRVIMGSSSEISRFGQPVTFSAFVYAPLTGFPGTGRFQFRVDGVDVGAPVALGSDGRAFLPPIANLGVGPHWLGGVFLGSHNFRPSAPVRLFQNVQRSYTDTTVRVTPSGARAGEGLILRAKVTAEAPGAGTPDGTVQFFVDGAAVGSPRVLANGRAHLSLPEGVSAGGHVFRAVYAGSDSYFGSHSPAVATVFNP